MMIVGSGMALDFMRQEAARADLQDALDRGVLAAASLSQTVVVDDDGDDDLNDEYHDLISQYMASRSFREKVPLLNIVETTTSTSKAVSATADYEIDTYFLKLIGIPTLPVPAYAEARHARNDVEISLVLDVSGSMQSNNVTVDGQTRTRLAQLKIDAKAFVSYLLDADVDEAGNPLNKTTFSIVPYSAQVRASDNLAAQFTNLQPFTEVSGLHDYSHCFDFDVADFKTVAMSPSATFTQFPHFREGGRFACPGAENEIVPITNNEAQLHAAIEGLQREGWTAIYNGVKWGAGLLDPAMRPAIDGLVSGGDVSATFSGLPRNYPSADDNLVKALVVMSDGQNTEQPIMRPLEYDGPTGNRGADYWNTNDPDQNYSNCNRTSSAKSFSKFSESCNIVAVAASNDYGVGRNQLSPGTRTEYSPGNPVNEPDAVLFEVCSRAKSAGIVVYTIGFELYEGSEGARALKECASGENKFYPVTGLNLSQAFDAIAADILNLKLTH